MTLIFCVDNNFGLMFNKRRQSRDSAVLEDLKNCFAGEKICISPYSEKLFNEAGVDYMLCDDFTKCDGVCFVEDKYSPDLFNLADEVILYHWGKVYPADLTFDVDLLNTDFTLCDTNILAGTSHKEIKKERYIR